MGLDQYAYKTKHKFDKQVDFTFPNDDESDRERIYYWRKHPDLEGWMAELYQSKGGASIEFNCDRLQLTKVDLLKLKDDVENETLPKTQGFFFGESYSEYKHNDLEFIEKALMILDDGYSIYYTSSW